MAKGAMTPISIQDGTITVKCSKGAIVMEIHHPYRFGEVVKLTPEQAGELAARLRLDAFR